MKTLLISDESMAGKVLHQISLQFESDYISVKELIEARVNKEIERFEQNQDSSWKGLILPTDLEKRLNAKKRRRIDPEKQLYVALEAFQKNGFFILIDDEQVEELDQRFLVDESTQVSFIKLTPLVGG
ncbi:hypothetical protein [Pontibacter sp. G13]|uniref:hypothetical protein n=1 Tax=Pontibacter sp. G13 TaxID=3074898 RepID=UPI0028893ACF|nr:hypothetical protein [Pontibacter sp. G13]WNJ18313.1 hypothetical protein RJD25_25960 [Pontibacter sp. G13]